MLLQKFTFASLHAACQRIEAFLLYRVQAFHGEEGHLKISLLFPLTLYYD